MRAGIFAAGDGRRLRPAAAPDTPKALVPVHGQPLIDWVLADLDRAGAADVVVIVNERSTAVRTHVERRRPGLEWIVESTPSSMHSFLRVVEALARDGDPGPFLLTTVDTIAPPGTFRRFLERAGDAPSDVVLALTTLVDDEQPLRIDVAGDATRPAAVTAVGNGPFATAGYYLVRPTVLREAAEGRARNFDALRIFFRHLFDAGYGLAGVLMPDSIDVDRPADLAPAERILQTGAAG